MTYRVIYSDFIRHRDGSYESVAGTERCAGMTEHLNDAHSTSLCYDTSYHIAWVEKLVDDVWYGCDHNGHLYESKIPADPQEVTMDD